MVDIPKTKYFVIWRGTRLGTRSWKTFTQEKKALEFYGFLKGARYRAVSFGLGNVLLESGRP